MYSMIACWDFSMQHIHAFQFTILILCGPCKWQYWFSYKLHTQRNQNRYRDSLVARAIYEAPLAWVNPPPRTDLNQLCFTSVRLIGGSPIGELQV
ncbi:hypothetical protein ASPBRDRAFT_585657 [Aspergillus brasiliensis CBS 101740]|uniref:Uncharacterized protein n=1 Tax=Aspergillus brasiliensis (strain CBS 101740 / IMI 381727 / IBT 21946) TaxID=767769 RepID=A0A1L9UKI7_ASPBC|nr:hypothetical protein ASPBRDRAFT_585657 [Aspergillus brasiliensis CBS 101740]